MQLESKISALNISQIKSGGKLIQIQSKIGSKKKSETTSQIKLETVIQIKSDKESQIKSDTTEKSELPMPIVALVSNTWHRNEKDLDTAAECSRWLQHRRSFGTIDAEIDIA